MILLDISDFCLQYDELLDVLRVEWITRSHMRGLRPSATRLLTLMEDLAVRHLLIDMNSVPNLLVADEIWLGAHWMPSLVALPLERLVLVIDNGQMHNQLAIDALHHLVQPAIRFDAQYFSDSEAAMHWLTDDSERLPVLLAEWHDRRNAAAPLELTVYAS